MIGTRCTRIVVHPTNSNRVFVATEPGVYRTDQRRRRRHAGPRRCRPATSSWRTTTPTCSTPASGTTASTRRSTAAPRGTASRATSCRSSPSCSGGRRTSRPGRPPGGSSSAIGRHGEGGSNFVVVKFGPNSATTAISSDAGASWLKIPGSEGVDYDEWCSTVAVHPRQPRHIYLGGLGLQHSTDGWNFSPSPGTHSDHHQIVFHPTARRHRVRRLRRWRVPDDRTTARRGRCAADFLSATQLMSLGVSSSGAVRRRLGDAGSGHHPDRRVVRLDGPRRRQRVGDVRRRPERLPQRLHLARRRSAATQHGPRPSPTRTRPADWSTGGRRRAPTRSRRASPMSPSSPARPTTSSAWPCSPISSTAANGTSCPTYGPSTGSTTAATADRPGPTCSRCPTAPPASRSRRATRHASTSRLPRAASSAAVRRGPAAGPRRRRRPTAPPPATSPRSRSTPTTRTSST